MAIWLSGMLENELAWLILRIPFVFLNMLKYNSFSSLKETLFIALV